MFAFETEEHIVHKYMPLCSLILELWPFYVTAHYDNVIVYFLPSLKYGIWSSRETYFSTRANKDEVVHLNAMTACGGVEV